MGKISFTTKGYIEVWYLPAALSPVFVSRHKSETEAVESLTAYAETLSGPGPFNFELRYPNKIVKAYGVLAPEVDTVAPSQPTGVTASALSARQVFVSWDASTDNIAVTGYQPYRNGVPLTQVTDTSFTDTGLSPSTLYEYGISAYDAAGNSSPISSLVQVTTDANTAPLWSDPGAQALTTGSGYFLDVGARVSDADSDTLTVTHLSGTLPTGVTYNSTLKTLNGTPTTVQSVSATFRASDGTASTDLSISFVVLNADTTAPTVPTGLAGDGIGGERIELTWTASSDQTVANARTSGLAGYKVYRDGSLRATLGLVTAYSDTVVAADTPYSYTLSAYDAAGNESAQCAAVVVSTAQFGWTIPDTPYTALPPTGSAWLPNTAGQTYDVSQYVNDPANVGVYTIGTQTKNSVAGSYGFTVNADTGVIAVPSNLPAPSGASDTYSVTVDLTSGAEITTLTLSGAGAWTFGQAFPDDATGSAINGYVTVAGGQGDVRNRWASGRVKFAVLSGVASSAGAVSIITSATDTMSGTEVALSSSPASVTFTGGVTGTYACPITNTVAAWSKSTSHLVRKIAGPVMTERHYYVPTSDAHVAVWFYVRSYSNGSTEVETVVENGWARVASPTEKAYTATITVNGTSVFSGAVAHRHHTRWSKRAWIVGGVTTSTEPVTPSHDMAYLRTTRLVPNYATTTVPESVLAALPQTINPMERGSFDFAGSGGGYHAFLGLLPSWEAAYVVSGDVRGYRAMLANEQAGNCCNMYGTAGSCTRDETTGKPIRHIDFPTDSYSNGYSPTYGAGKVYLGTNTSANVWTTDPAHSWASGYLAYLITGRWFSLESAQFLTGTDYLCWGLAVGNGGLSDRQRWMNGEDRHCGWSLRQMACSFAITPDGDSWRTGMVTHLTEAISRWHTNEVGFNNLGIRLNIYNNTDYSVAPYNSCGAFQQWFLAQAFAFGYDIAADSLDATTKANWLASAKFHLSMPVGMLGTRPGGFCYQRAGIPPNQNFAIGPDRTKPLSASSFYGDWGTVYDTLVALGTIPVESCAAGGALQGYGFTVTADAYWGNIHPAAAYAVDFGVTGASTAYARMTAASNYGTLTASFGTYPQFAVVKR